MDFLLSLNKRKYIFKIISAFVTILAFMRILEKEGALRDILAVLLLLFTVNNFYRRNYLKDKRDIWFSLSYGFSVLILGCFHYEILFVGTYLFNIILLIETIIFTGKLNRPLLAFHFGVYLASLSALVDFTSLKSAYEDYVDILLNFFMPCLIMLLFRSVLGEKMKYENLNKELEEANSTLKAYADKIEELAKTQERNRIAQELHDSMGHSLMALNMNLEYAQNVMITKPDKALEVIHKTRNMTKDCVSDLRKVVSLLKDSYHTEQLRGAMNELFHNFRESGNIRFHLNMDDSIEEEAPEVKDCIYKISREAITNGIKHGKAASFTIDILDKPEGIYLRIENNGSGSRNIIKSNGITGMEERVKLLGGKMEITSGKEEGFCVDINIPKL